MSREPHEKARRLIRAFLTGRIAPEQGEWLTGHLLECDVCLASYDRMLVATELDPDGLPAAKRLAIGLGISRPSRSKRRWPLAAAVGLAATVAAVLLAVFTMSDPAPAPAQHGFTVRSAGDGARQSALVVYRLDAHTGPAQLSSGQILAGDELAFAYRNPTGKQRLMVFGLDSAGEVYWYFPAWKESSEDPRAIPITPGSGLQELPEAVHHRVRGERLVIYALFTDRDLSVKAVEGAIAEAGVARLPEETDDLIQVVELGVGRVEQ